MDLTVYIWKPVSIWCDHHLPSPSHRVDQVVDCGLWNVGPLLFNGCAKLLDIGRNWNMLSYTPIQSIPNMLNGWHVWWVCWPCKNWDVFSFQELCTDPCNMGPCIIMLQHEVMVVDEWHNNGPQDLITVSLCIQNAINKMHLCSLSIAYACPYHNPTATMGHSIHNVDISKPLTHTTPYTLSIQHSIHGQQLWWTFLQSACRLHAPSKLATSVALCCVIKLHILEWPFIVASLRHTCAIIMLSNLHLDMPHLWGGWIISAKEKCSLTHI